MDDDHVPPLVAAITAASAADLKRLVATLADAERETGRPLLAQAMAAVSPPPTESLVDRLFRAKLTHRRSQSASLPCSLDGLVTFVPRETLEHDMVLPEAIEERLRRIEQEWAARDRLLVHGLRPRQRILLHGPSGCGKSLAASRLGWNCGLPLVHVRAGVLGASDLGAVFGHARATACVLVLDECERLVQVEAARAVLLQQLEVGMGRSLVVATATTASGLDAALVARFDEVLELSLPVAAEIDQLLRLALSAMRCEGGMPWAELAQGCVGQSAAVVVRVVREAAKSMVLQGGSIVTRGLLRAAVAGLGKVGAS